MSSKKPFLVALLIHALSAGMILLSKAAFNGGMNTFVFVFYRQVTGTLFLAPLAIVLERKSPKPLSLAIFSKIFLLALLGITFALNIYGVALVYTSASLGSATINCIPVITFAFAVLLRMEKVNVRMMPGIVKLVGIALCMAGGVILAFYKGPGLKPPFHGYFHVHDSSDKDHNAPSHKNWASGCFLLFVSTVCWALWLVLQAKMLKSYPSKLSFTTLQCLSSAVQSFFVAILMERDPSQWKLGFNVRLLAIVYCGVIVNGVAYYLQAWVLAEKGPVFLAVMTPANLVMTILGSVFFLAEVVNLGSIIGAILLVISLYCVLWGKSKEWSMDGLPVVAKSESTVDVKVAAESNGTDPPAP
ncbi:hypothetical protein SLA2020_425010 [Shorea laevis]